MQQDKYAKSAGAGPDTGYVDKALMADKLKTARTIALTGGVGGSASFDGSGNISIATTLSITENDVPSLPSIKSGMQVRRHRAMSAPPPDRYRYWMLPAN